MGRRSRSKGYRSRSRRGRSRSRGRGSGSKSRSSSRRRDRKKTERDLAKFERNLRELKEGSAWKKVGNQRQAEFNNLVRRILVDDMKNAFVDHFGKEEDVPVSFKKVVETGEKEFDDQNLDLRRSDATSWRAVENFKRNPLCKTDKEEKKWEKAVRKAEDEAKKVPKLGRGGFRQRNYSVDGGRGGGGYGGGRGGYGAGRGS